MGLKCLRCGSGQALDEPVKCDNCGHSDFAEAATTNLKPEGDALLPSVPSRPLRRSDVPPVLTPEEKKV